MIVDYAWNPPGGTALTAAGITGVIRYLSHDPTKNLQAAELADLHAHGIAVALVWETTANRAADGYDAGTRDAIDAYAKARALGFPDNRPIYFAVDYDIDQQSASNICISGYLAGATNLLGRDIGGRNLAGVYGGWNMIDAAALYGYYHLWQTEAWSGGRWHPAAGLRQSGQIVVNGTNCDTNLNTVGDWGQWAPPTPLPAPAWPGRYLQVWTPYMTGDDIRDWQARMSDRGWKITVDEIYGPATEAVCRQFQAEKGLTQDGIVGPHTWDAAFRTDNVTP